MSDRPSNRDPVAALAAALDSASAAFSAAAAAARRLAPPDPPVKPTSAPIPLGGANAAGCVLPDLGGWQFHPPGDPWRQDVAALPVHPKSADILAYHVGVAGGTTFGLNAGKGDGTGYALGFPYNVVPENQPPVPVTYDPTYGMKDGPPAAPIPDNPSVAGVAFGAPVPVTDLAHPETPGSDERAGDHHLIILVRDDTPTSLTFGGIKEVWELYSVWKDPKTGWNVRRCTVTYPGVAPWDQIPECGPSVNAGGTLLVGGLVTCAELQRAAASGGDLGHALRFNMHVLMGRLVPPARSGGGQCDRWNNPLALPNGARLRLKASFDVASVNAANYPTNPRNGKPFSDTALAQARAILRTVQKYGMVADDASGSGNFELQGTLDSAWDLNYPEVQALLNEVEAAANLEVLDFEPGFTLTMNPPSPTVGQPATLTVALTGTSSNMTANGLSVVPQWYGDPDRKTPTPGTVQGSTYHAVFDSADNGMGPKPIGYKFSAPGTYYVVPVLGSGLRYEPAPLRVDVAPA